MRNVKEAPCQCAESTQLLKPEVGRSDTKMRPGLIIGHIVHAHGDCMAQFSRVCAEASPGCFLKASRAVLCERLGKRDDNVAEMDGRPCK